MPGSMRSASPTAISSPACSPSRRQRALAPAGRALQEPVPTRDRLDGLVARRLLEHQPAPIEEAGGAVGAPRFPFGSAQLLLEVLGHRPGQGHPLRRRSTTPPSGRRRARAEMLGIASSSPNIP